MGLQQVARQHSDQAQLLWRAVSPASIPEERQGELATVSWHLTQPQGDQAEELVPGQKMAERCLAGAVFSGRARHSEVEGCTGKKSV